MYKMLIVGILLFGLTNVNAKGRVVYTDKYGNQKTEYVNSSLDTTLRGLKNINTMYNVVNDSYSNFLVEVAYSSYLTGKDVANFVSEIAKGSYDAGGSTARALKRWIKGY